MAAAAVMPHGIDTGALSAFLDIDVSNLQDVVNSAADSVVLLLQQVQAKAREYEEIIEAKTQLQVDYEQEVHTNARRTTSMKEQLQKSITEAQDLKTKLNNLESDKSSGSAEISSLKSANATLEETIARQKSRIETVETSHRDTLTLLEKKNAEISRNEEDYKQLQTKYIETRREISTMENALQEAQSQVSILTYKEQSSQQEIDFLRKDNERLAAEVNTKSSDFSTYRKEKSAQISQLQSELEEVSATANANAEQNRLLKRRLEQSSTELERALSKSAVLTDQLTTQEETHRSEMASQIRLAELWERSCKETQDRNRELEAQLERDQEKYAEELARWQLRVQKEEARANELETRTRGLEAQIERFEAQIEMRAIAAGQLSPVGLNGSRHGSPEVPSSRAQFSPSSASGIFSPSAQALAKHGRSGMSLTQLYSELHTARQNETLHRRRAEKLREEFDQYREDVERWAPEYQHTLQEFEQQKKEIAEMSVDLQTAIAEKEEAERQFKWMKNQITDKERETQLYHKQSRDLGRQVQHLLRELQEREMGLNGDLTEEERRVMQEMNDAYEAGLNYTDTDKIISERLTIFHNIVQLQEQNQNLRRITRELGEKMEQDEKEYQSKIENLESEALDKATEVINQLRDELKSTRTKMESHIRERDRFRRMVLGRGGAASDTQTTGPTSQPVVAPTEEQQNLLRELQAQFDSYRNEAAIDQRTLNDQIRTLTSGKSEALINAAKYKSQMELANERYKILQGNMEMVKQESEELRRRNQRLQEQQAKQDIKFQQAAEELVDVRAFVESLRTENANIKAEKTLFKNIEQRLQSDNEALMNERTRLNNLLSNLQTMQNERERQENESRRRALKETERLEGEVQSLKSKLSEESEETRRLASLRELESRELQERIAKMNVELASAREQLVAATTARDQLQARVEEQAILLKSSEAKLAVFSKPGTSTHDVNHEQQLEVEIAELKKALELTKTELRDAREYAEKMKDISATAEEVLQDMNIAHDKFKETMDQQLADKETELRKVKDQLEIVSNELQTSNKELSQIQGLEDEKRHAAEQENKSLQAEVARLREVEEKAQLSQGFYQEDLRAQAHIAQEAQLNYERELVKHAEAAQTVQQLREEVGNLRTEMRVLRTQAETATATLQSSEASWETQKVEYERELREVRTRADDLVKQNNILHQQFESVASQAQQIRQRTDSDLAALEESSSQEPTVVAAGKEDSVEGLREVIKYLRREKEIVDIKFELLQQENRRLKQQLERTTADLDGTRVLLMTEREKEANAATTSAQHQELLGKINELNILRESNTTLRNELDRAMKRAGDLEAKVSQLTGQLAPLEETVRTLQAEIESKDDQMRLLTEDNERWKIRTQQILQKYDRIDPVELQKLKDQLEAANTEKGSLTEQLNEQRERNKSLAEAWKTRHEKAIATAKQRLDHNRETIEKLEAQVQEATTQSGDIGKIRQEAENTTAVLNQQISSLQSQLDEIRQNPPPSADATAWETEKKAMEESVQQKDAEIGRIAGLARGAERAKVTATSVVSVNNQREALAKVSGLEEQIKTLQEQAVAQTQPSTSIPGDEEFEKRVAEEVEKRISSAPTNLNDAQLQERLAQAEMEKQQAIADAVQANQQASNARVAELNDAIAAKNKEIDDLRAVESSGQATVDIDAKIAEAVQAREAELKEIHEKEVKAAAEAGFRKFKQPSEEKVREGAIKHGTKLFNERWEKFLEEQAAGGNTVIQEQISTAVEEATKKKDEEFAERLARATDGAKKEAIARSQLEKAKLDRNLKEANVKLQQYEQRFGPLPSGPQNIPQPSPQQHQQPQIPAPQYPPVLVQGQPMTIADLNAQYAGQQVPPQQQRQQLQGGTMMQNLQAGRGVAMPIQTVSRRGGIPHGQGRGGGRGQQRVSGQHPQQQQFQPQQGQIQGHRPAVNRPVVSGSPGQPQQQQQQPQGRRPGAQQSQLPRPTAGGLNVGAAPFQPSGMKRPLEDEVQAQGNQAVGQKRTRTGGGEEHAGGEGTA